MTTISVFMPRIPEEAWNSMLTKKPSVVYSDMLEKKTISVVDAKTFAYLVTPIINNETGKIVAYVLFWETSARTIHSVNGIELPLVGVDFGKQPTPDEALALFYKYIP